MKKKDIKIALVQMISEKAAIDRNLELTKRYIAASRENGVDIICFPEMNITGYIDPVKYPHAIITFDHMAVDEVIKLSAQYSMCIIAGFVEFNPNGKPYITQFVAHSGKILGFYRSWTYDRRRFPRGRIFI